MRIGLMHFACFALIAAGAFAQQKQKLTLNINDPAKNVIALTFDNTLLKSKDVVKVSGDWNFEIIGDFPEAKVVITKNTPPNDSVILPVQSQIFPIKNNTLFYNSVSFQFSGGVSIKIMDGQKGTIKKYQNIVFPSNTSEQNIKSNSAMDYKAGEVYYDALYLSSTTNGNTSAKRRILQYYTHTNNWKAASDSLKGNKFLQDLKQKLDTIGEAYAAGIPPLSSLSISSFGGLDVTTLADGMAKFLVRRTKQELAITFFERFKEAIADTACRDLRTLFPATYATLAAIGDQIYYYDAYIQTLRESFEKDLRDLSTHLPSVIENHPDYFARHPEIEAILRSGCYIAGALKSEEPFGVILRNYPMTYLNNVNPNIKASIQTLRLISESLRDTAIVNHPNAYWVTPQQIQTLVNDSIALKIYLGLLYQQTKNNPIIFGNNDSLTTILNSIAVKFNIYSYGYRTYLTNLGERTNTLTDLISKYKTLSNDTIKLQQYYQYITAGIDLLESATDVGRLGLSDPSISNAHVFFEHAKDSLFAYITTIRSAANLVWDVKRRSYASAVVNAASLYATAFPDDSTQTGRNLLKYGTFMATIVQAKNSDEIESAIEATALPAGSARIKRESYFDVALNAYVGGFYGRETEQSANIASTSNIYGINAPIGIAFSTSYNLTCDWIGKKCWRCPLYLAYPFKSITLFGSIIDLGAVTTYRVRNDTISSLPKIALANIIAPGIHIVLGVNGAPISLGFGWQIGPQLRDVTSTTTEISNVQGYRWAAFVAVDIPLLDFYTKPRD